MARRTRRVVIDIGAAARHLGNLPGATRPSLGRRTADRRTVGWCRRDAPRWRHGRSRPPRSLGRGPTDRRRGRGPTRHVDTRPGCWPRLGVAGTWGAGSMGDVVSRSGAPTAVGPGPVGVVDEQRGDVARGPDAGQTPPPAHPDRQGIGCDDRRTMEDRLGRLRPVPDQGDRDRRRGW